ncbi:MAG: AraC family transcriptional regulator, partial [Planctomycetota bacterium]
MRFVADLPSTDEFTPWCVCAPTRAGEDENVAVFRSDSVVIDRYRARPGGSLWALDRVRTHMLVFPRRFVQIEQAGREPVIASPDRVMFYNAGQEFRRRFVGEPDVNDAFHFPTAVLREALQRVDPALAEGDPIFPIASAPIPAEVYLLQRRVTAGAPAMTELEATEAALRVLDATLRATAGALRGDRPGPRRPRATDAHRDAVDAVIRAIAADPSASHSLDGLAGLAGVSVYHLCRIFRRRTG